MTWRSCSASAVPVRLELPLHGRLRRSGILLTGDRDAPRGAQGPVPAPHHHPPGQPRESPDHPPFLKVGDHFEEGDPLYIIEVMKMFNKVYASFSGTVEEVLIEQDGVIVSQGQRLFRIKPDFVADPKSNKDIAFSQAASTEKLLKYF